MACDPTLVDVLSASPETIMELRDWGWVLVWNTPDAKIFSVSSWPGASRRDCGSSIDHLARIVTLRAAQNAGQLFRMRDIRFTPSCAVSLAT